MLLVPWGDLDSYGQVHLVLNPRSATQESGNPGGDRVLPSCLLTEQAYDSSVGSTERSGELCHFSFSHRAAPPRSFTMNTRLFSCPAGVSG